MRPGLMLFLVTLLLAPAAAGLGAHEHEARPERHVQPPLADDDPLTVYTTWPHLTVELRELAAAHPDVMRLVSAGKSSTGMDLWLVEIADFENPDAVPLGEREVLWVDGGTHANEYSGVMFVMHLLRFLVEGYGENETATWIVENRHTYIMPLLNPEGSLNGVGRLNDRLVNINRNYPVGWGDLEEAPLVNNPGPYPGSEPETGAVVEWWARLQPDYMASIHCCGNLWLYPYGIEGRDPHVDDRPVLERICDEAFYDVREDCGPIWSTIYPASGSSVDTAYELTGAVSFGYEMSGREAMIGWGFPFTTTPVEETESESWRGVLHAFRNVHLYGGHPVVSVDAVQADAVRLRITNTGFGNLTQATVRVTDADGLAHEVDVPPLGPNETVSLRVPGPFQPGAHAVELTWTPRPLAPESQRALHLLVEDRGALSGTLVAAHEAAPPEGVTLTDADEVESRVPGPAAIAGVLALGLAARGRRRT